ncbi:MAG TPA: rod shape-determining protein MreC [Gaiellaceae bacterium]|nr:rod shape-determining protein MreC [Gaiellaceae bacterium]
MATRGRSARSAALAQSVQRSKPTPYPSKVRSALVRRAVLVALVLVSLTLLTISFRSPTSGALHDIQGVGSSVLRPFQIAASRVAQPFRDAYDYFDGLAKAKSENAKLRREVQYLRSQQLISLAKAQQEEQLAKLLRYQEGPTFPKGYRAVTAQVISASANPFARKLVIAAGSSAGIRQDAPVVSADGLVGIVSNVFPDTAVVTLLSDSQTVVPAVDLRTNARGTVHPSSAGQLILDYVSKQLPVHVGDELVTLGTIDPRYPDLYPHGIAIGRVTYAHATDTSSFLQVELQPFANLGSLQAVSVLVATKKHHP